MTTRLVISASALALAACQAAPAPVAVAPAPVVAAQSTLPYPLTAEGARSFIAATEKELFDLTNASQRADWSNATNITDDTDTISAEYAARLTAAQVRYALQAAQYAKVAGLTAEEQRKLTILRTSITLPGPTTPGANDRLAELQTRLKSTYGKGKGTLHGKPINGSDIEAAMRDPKLTPADYKEMWTSWHDNVGKPMKGDFAELVEIANAGSRELGFADTGAMWRSNYDMPPEAFAAETERLWQEVRPLYMALHTYVRHRLNQKYGEAVQPARGPIRADLLGNMWAQAWGGIYPMVAPKGSGDIGYDVTDLIAKKKMDHVAMVKTGENFFSSLGFAPLPATFWSRSMFVKPTDREVVCHASAWDVDQKDDLRIKMCIKPTGEDFTVIHHELGHNYYQRAYNDKDVLYLNGANDGFHEAIGDMIALSITPEYLVQIGMLDRAKVPSADKDIGLLLDKALDKVAFLPFGLMVDKWRWGVFDGSIKPAGYSQGWDAMRLEYQGITPPSTRGADAFDPGAKYHVSASVPYMRYFLADILQFQFYKAACDQAGWKGPLHRCSFYGNKAVGAKLNQMLAMGASKPWPDALEAFTGSRQMSAKPILEYFAPLKAWLDEQNKGQPQGW